MTGNRIRLFPVDSDDFRHHHRQLILLLIMLRISFFTTSALFFHLLVVAPAQAADPTQGIPGEWNVREAVQFALKNNPDIVIAGQRTAIAVAAADQSESAFSPQISLNAQYSQTDTPMYSFGNILNQGAFDNSINFNDPGRTDNLSFGADLHYRIYNGGRDEAALKASQAEISAVRSEMTDLRGRISFAVVRAFVFILQAEETLQARTSALEAIDSSLEVARARFDAGDLLKADLLELELEKSKAGENKIQAEHTLEIAKREFRTLLGLKEGETILKPTPECTLEIPAVANDLNSHPQLQKIDAMILAAQERIYQAEGAKLPAVDGFLNYQVDKGFEHDGAGNSWAAGVKAGYPLFDGNLTSSSVSIARARLAEVMAVRKKTALALNLDQERAALALRQAKQRVEVTRHMVSQADESAQLNRARFKEGVILASDLINVENQLTDALVRHSLARTDIWIATADLRRAHGLTQF